MGDISLVLIVAAEFRGRGEESHQVGVPLHEHAGGHGDAEPDLPAPVQHLERRA